jgi:cytochrome c oxidase subunit 2
MVQHYLQQASTYAADIDDIIMLVMLLVGFWFVLAEILLIGLTVRYRRRKGVKAQYISGESMKHQRWILVPLVLIVLCDTYIAVADGAVWDKVKLHTPENPAGVVRVTAQQWAWTFVHAGPDGKLDTADDITMMNEMHVEVDKPYLFELESLDVLHSFSVPVFRLKQDAIPGRIITGWFEATKTGNFSIQCTEICGIGHGLMPARIIIESQEQHAAWMADNSAIRIAAAVSPATSQE